MRVLLSTATSFLMALVLSQCAHRVETRKDYTINCEEPRVNGARLTAEMVTTGGLVNYSLGAMVYFVARETEAGPYKCLLTAWGERGTHRSMTVERITLDTGSQQIVRPSSSGPIPFAPGAGGKGWQATHVLPGVVHLDYENDAPLAIAATVAIRSQARTMRENVSLTLAPAESRDVHFTNILDEL